MESLYHVETGGYEWSDWAVYIHPARPTSYFVWTEHGCSCDGWSGPTQDNINEAIPMTKAEVRDHFSKWWDGDDTYENPYAYDGTPQEKVRHLEKLVQALAGKWLRTGD